MLTPASPLARLLTAPMRPGRIAWIGLRPGRHADLVAVDQARLDPAAGLAGDHYAGRSGNRQLSLIQAEHLVAIAAYLGRDAVTPFALRRNIVTSGLNLGALHGARLRIGGATILVTGACHPCSRMEAILGPGGYNAVRGHGGVVARVLAPGSVRIGDAIERLDGEEPPA